MSVWLFIGAIAFLVVVSLGFASRSRKDQQELVHQSSSNEDHFKVQLAEIEAGVKAGRLDAQGAEAAKAELARELMRHRARAQPGSQKASERLIGVGLPVVSLVSVGLAIAAYAVLGTPDQPAAPMAMRLMEQGNPISFSQAITRVETQLLVSPDDIDGWQVLAPAYMRSERYADAANAYRRILELTPPTPDTLTDLAQALLFENQGVASPEAIAALEQAVEMDPTHPRSRFFLAGDATRRQEWDNAINQWNELIALSGGDEPWLEVAQNGLSVAVARGETSPQVPDATSSVTEDTAQVELIRSMVAGLAERLDNDGGSIAEWTRLVRSYLVLGEAENARLAYEKAKVAYPEAEERTELDAAAREADLTGEND